MQCEQINDDGKLEFGFPKLNLQLWKTDSPALQVPEAILIQTLEKGTQSLAQRRKEEYELWEHSKQHSDFSIFAFLSCRFYCFVL